MSQDLLAAFGFANETESKPNSAARSGNSSVFFDNSAPTGLTAAAPASIQALFEGDDDWGEFETAEATVTSPPVKTEVPAVRYKYNLDDLGPQRPSMLQSRTNTALSTNLAHNTRSQTSNQKTVPATKESNVLFDVSEPSDDGNDLEDFEDFGDFEDYGTFESSNPQPTIVQKPAEFDLLGLDDVPLPVTSGPPHKTHYRAPSNPKPKPPKFVDSTEADEPWDDIPEPTPDNEVDISKLQIEEELNLSDFPGSQNPNLAKDTVPPTTVPPPSLLLSLFPTIFETMSNQLLKPLSNANSQSRQTILSNQQSQAYLKGYLVVVIVLARIIAGRKHRWKRDTLLAQSVRIGPASSSRLTGMKVASVDKAEVAREDREVAEVLRQWNQQVGRVKSAISEAKKFSVVDFDPIPELRETMPVRVAKEVDGGVSSAKPCALCGLKREERIGKVDVNVMDSFGEWWIERTNMHSGKHII
jgi:hypothetical protein